MMKICELKPDARIDELIVEIVEDGEVVDFAGGKVKSVGVKDESSEDGRLSLWNDDIKRFKVGDCVRVLNGWCKIYNKRLHASPGKYGALEKFKTHTGV